MYFSIHFSTFDFYTNVLISSQACTHVFLIPPPYGYVLTFLKGATWTSECELIRFLDLFCFVVFVFWCDFIS